jgi:peptide/nickel transport system ATP-binding protein
VSDAINAVVVSDEITKARRDKVLAGKPILQLKNVQTWFGTSKNFLGKTTEYVKAVDDVSFDVYEGETLGLVGESGCGKTTLGRTILRLIPANGGEIIFEGRNLLDLNNHDMKLMREHMQIIFQDPYSSLNPRITIGNAIMEPMTVHGVYANEKERKEKVLDLLKKVNMKPEHFNRYPHEFSGGQRQRICIARALSLNPKFIICDESVSALDVSVQAQVLNLLIQLREEFKFTYIFISHDLSVVKFMSDRMVVMNKGKIEEMGISDDIYNNPQREYTQKLIAAIPKGELNDIRRRMATVKATLN